MGKIKKTAHSIIIILLVILIYGCGYDNTLYNARKAFKTARERPLNQNGVPSPQAIEDYMKTIKKCGVILTERKNSPQADDALYLLAQALYYKGNSYYQAKDQLQSLIRNFPNSPYVHEAVLLLAEVNRKINEPEEAENLLVAYIRDPKASKWHPKALLLLADFALQDKDYAKARYWLEYSLERYPKAKDTREALFLLGKNYYEQKEYDKSLEQFKKITGSRNVRKDVKLDSRFYIALNYLALNEDQKSLTTVKRLLRDEYRPEKLPGLNLLVGRALLKLKDEDKAIELLESIISSNIRTLSSAEAYYRLGEFYYYKKHKVDEAIEKYGKVKSEFATSPFAEEAENKNNALKAIYQSPGKDFEQEPRKYVEHKLEIAENFYNLLNLPDSAYAVYDSILHTPDKIQVMLDSLYTQKTMINSELDSLLAVTDTTALNTIVTIDTTSALLEKEAVPDTLMLTTREEIEAADSLEVEEIDNSIPKGNINSEEMKEITDSLVVKAVADTITTEENNLNRIKSLQAQLHQTEADINNLIDVRQQFEEDYIPFTLFVKASVIYRSKPESDILQNILTEMKNRYPQDKYTRALQMLLDGKPVILVDPELENQKTQLDSSLAEIGTTPDSALVNLEELTNSSYREISLQSNFRLGWYYVFEQPDTTKAKVYLDRILQSETANDFKTMVQRFYNGNVFTLNFAQEDSLNGSGSFPDSLLKTPDELNWQLEYTDLLIGPLPDSINTKTPADSLNIKTTPDTSQVLKEDENTNNMESQPSGQDFIEDNQPNIPPGDLIKPENR